MLLGCIADDFTGATDLANMLVRGGMRTLLTIGVPPPAAKEVTQADAVVVALKSRTIAPALAVEQSLQALAWLRQAGARQFFFKYCSTFDSTDAGNIGCVTDALMQALGTDFTIACPAFPENGRSVYRGHLFVNDMLLSESGMQNHPLTPMKDANLVRVLQKQTPSSVGLARYDTVARGAVALRETFTSLRNAQVRIAIVDAVSDQDLRTIGAACQDLALLTGGSGVALGLPGNFQARGQLQHAGQAAALPASVGAGHALVISGSCSQATNAQVAHWQATRPAFRIDPLRLHAGEPVVQQALAWAGEHLHKESVLIYATSTAAEVAAVQAKLGVHAAGELVERALGEIAQQLVPQRVRKVVVAGGETSGAVVSALGATVLRVGPQIDPGVPWMVVDAAPPIALALKSGNFGAIDFFSRALAQLEQAASR